ncbi:MAG: hypothetical protein Satyrvirus7_12 [Satyrvirus sp.]|uniref:Uncharacterized protein n=1 Tax=Satyrvirus sp. TaxID=2487771 RepID=A0A3G5ADL7_9VIRU|nr:MAG: hypothetical protein Satyrvirus7_12 [Satyrvirus sp.]
MPRSEIYGLVFIPATNYFVEFSCPVCSSVQTRYFETDLELSLGRLRQGPNIFPVIHKIKCSGCGIDIYVSVN